MTPPYCHGRGHTLLELLIAVALGLLVSAIAVSLYLSQQAALGRAEDTRRLREAGMTALNLLGQQIQMAGFAPLALAANAGGPALFGCTGARPAGETGHSRCASASGRSDGIEIRYMADVVSTWPTLAGQPTDCLGQGLGAALDGGGERGEGGEGDLRQPSRPVVNRFHARSSRSTGQPELYCEGSGRSGVSQPLVEGIEVLRFRYWLAGASHALEAAALPAEAWDRVVAVEACVQARGSRQFSPPARYVDCDDVLTKSPDGYVRRTFRRYLTLRNRETPL